MEELPLTDVVKYSGYLLPPLLDKQQFSPQASSESHPAATYRSTELSRMRFKGGVADYLSVLDSERSLYAAQQTLIGDELIGQQNLVSLYKAMGGGWY